jgi:hypothetical protein
LEGKKDGVTKNQTKDLLIGKKETKKYNQFIKIFNFSNS